MIENILPKFDEAVILIYLVIFVNVLRPSMIALCKIVKSFWHKITLATSFVESVASFIDYG